MMLFMYKFECQCGNIFEAPELDEYNYGEFILRNDLDEMQCVFGPDDSAFAEVIKLVKANENVAQLSDSERSDLAQRVFAISCDKSKHGGSFEMNVFQKCPKCRSRKMKQWGQIYPVKPFDIDMKTVTHTAWDALSMTEKKDLVDADVAKRLSENG